MYTVRLSVRLGRNRDSEGPAPPRLADNRALSRLAPGPVVGHDT